MTDNSILNSLKWRYAAKKFDSDKKIPSETIKTILQAANLTATSLGIQPFKMVLIDNSEVIESLQEITLNQQNIQTCSHLLILCAETNVDATYIDKYISYVEGVRNLEPDSLVGYKKMCKSYIGSLTDDNKIDWIKRQSYIVLGNLLNTCASLGIDSCPMEGFDAKRLDEKLHLKEKNLQSVLLLPLGYRAADDTFASIQKVRKPLEDMVISITQPKYI